MSWRLIDNGSALISPDGSAGGSNCWGRMKARQCRGSLSLTQKNFVVLRGGIGDAMNHDEQARALVDKWKADYTFLSDTSRPTDWLCCKESEFIHELAAALHEAEVRGLKKVARP